MTDKPKAIEGVWEGKLKVGGVELRLVLRVSKESDGSLNASVDSPDQGAMGLKVDSIELDDDGVTRFEMKTLSAKFEGTRDEVGNTIVGEFTQAGTTLPLVLGWQERASELPRPQEPQKPYPYRAEEVRYENKAGGVTLAGTLTIPTGQGSFPAALLISGSGPQDRDESLFGHKPFLVLADYLTRMGIAVLRVDDRGVGGSTGQTRTSTSEDLAGDVEAGVAFLKTRPEVDPAKIGLIGHSEGGIIAPMVAAQSAEIAYVVLMAGPGLPGEEILILQGALVAKAEGKSDDQIAENRELQERIFEIIRSEKDPQAAEARMRLTIKDGLTRLSAVDKEAASVTVEFVEAQVQAVQSPWFRFFLTYDPRPALRKVKCPVLALNGEKDLQVPARENLAAIEGALKVGHNPRMTVKELPKLNHLFQTSETGRISEYARNEETIAPIALELIGSWIKEQVEA
jgi:fermentation-respiration switch protein FrsA (DUF1100 family)